MESQNKYPHLEAWKHPDHYIGASWHGWYIVIGQNRDSGALARANFDAMKAALEPLNADIDLGECRPDNDGPSVQVIRESHWACGWIEWIGVHSSNVKACELAEQLAAELEDYPVLNEELYSQYEDEECETVWTKCFDTRERLDYFRRHGWSNHSGSIAPLLRAIRGDWYEAGNLLHCPSDLLS